MSEQTGSKEKRRFKRFPANITLEISDNMKPGKKIAAIITDISEGGLAFESNQKLEMGSSVNLQVETPLSVQGGVVHVEERGAKFRYGIRFSSVRFQQMKREFSRPRTMVRMPKLEKRA